MFQNRKSSLKPNDGFVRDFQSKFAGIVPTIDSQNVGLFIPEEPTMDMTDTQPIDDTPPLTTGESRSPPPLDLSLSSSLSFASLSPSSWAMGTILHNQAGDLHTPTRKMDCNAPFSFPTPLFGTLSDTHHTPTFSDLFDQQSIWEGAQTKNPYTQQMYAPSVLLPIDSDNNTIDRSVDASSLNDVVVHASKPTIIADQCLDRKTFRFSATLRAQTAMIEDKTQTPVTYLNKGHPYAISIVDSTPPQTDHPIKYRTYFRVSFEEREQQLDPVASWQLWKDGRGAAEAQQRDGELLAVEYVDSIQGEIKGQEHNRPQLEHASFDGFSVTWTAMPKLATSDCVINMRFNFLSTDFRLAKGVKGVSVRLCAKTQIISDVDVSDGTSHHAAEVCYCKVKLFRDHGAERKLYNDAAYVKKTIEKLNEEILQAEMGYEKAGKRKRNVCSGAEEIPKRRRTLSVDLRHTDLATLPPGKDHHAKLRMMHDMLASNRSVSMLDLLGDEKDDPDLFPVQLPPSRGDPIMESEGLSCQETNLSQPSSDGAAPSSPTNRTISLKPLPFYHNQLDNFKDGFSKEPMKVERNRSESHQTRFINAIEIDPTYKPPTRVSPPVACFFMRFVRDEGQQDTYYRAVYLSERTVRNLTKQISKKQQINPERVSRVLHVRESIVEVMTDQDVWDLPEGQDMVVEFVEGKGGNLDIKLEY
ncbi:CP2 transcription factor-domain-containing protein [Aspergillus californicus]